MVSTDRLSRTRTALDELESGEMEVKPNPDGTFDVKGYTVDLDDGSCSCKDYEYRVNYCKHIMAARLQAIWGNIEDESLSTNDTPPKPEVLAPQFDAVPEYLREIDQWVCWKQKLHENKDGTKRWTKVPVDVSGGFASSTDPETWTTFEEAVGYFNTNDEIVGIGIVVSSEHDDLIGVDVDDCRNPETGELDETTQELVESVETYGEVSPSGTGVRMFVRGESAAPDACEADLPGEAHIEKYVTGRYLTVTGHQLESLPNEVNNDEDTIERVDALTSEAVDTTLDGF